MKGQQPTFSQPNGAIWSPISTLRPSTMSGCTYISFCFLFLSPQILSTHHNSVFKSCLAFVTASRFIRVQPPCWRVWMLTSLTRSIQPRNHFDTSPHTGGFWTPWLTTTKTTRGKGLGMKRSGLRRRAKRMYGFSMTIPYSPPLSPLDSSAPSWLLLAIVYAGSSQ